MQRSNTKVTEVEDKEWLLVDHDYPKLRFKTLNTHCLPRHLEFIGGSYNSLKRAQAIAEEILAGDYDVVGLQEVWDDEVLEELKKILAPIYPNVSHSKVVTVPNLFFYRYLLGKDADSYVGENLIQKMEIPFHPGGLATFSKLELKPLEEKVHVYEEKEFGEETVARKEFRADKFPLGDDKFFTYINTHLPAGGALLKTLQSKIRGTTTFMRSVDAREISDEVMKNGWHKASPAGTTLTHKDTFLAGDFNDTYDTDAEYESKSTGESYNGFLPDEIKCKGRKELMDQYDFVLPENFEDIREPVPEEKGAGKKIDPQKEAEAQRDNKMTGTNLGTNPPVSIIDVMTIAKNPDDPNGEFKTYIQSSNGNSDHNSICGEYNPNAPRIVRKNKYDSCPIVLSREGNPSAGLLNNLFNPGEHAVYKFVQPESPPEEKSKQADLAKKSWWDSFSSFFSGDSKIAAEQKMEVAKKPEGALKQTSVPIVKI